MCLPKNLWRLFGAIKAIVGAPSLIGNLHMKPLWRNFGASLGNMDHMFGGLFGQLVGRLFGQPYGLYHIVLARLGQRVLQNPVQECVPANKMS